VVLLVFTGAPLVVPPFRGTSGGSGISSGGSSGGEKVLKMRKPIQICQLLDYDEPADVGEKVEAYVPASALVALCDDGTMWLRWFNSTDPEWFKLPDIPQDEDNGTT
jgi:hypothetical protein